jgi:hypothetical protein
MLGGSFEPADLPAYSERMLTPPSLLAAGCWYFTRVFRRATVRHASGSRAGGVLVSSCWTAGGGVLTSYWTATGGDPDPGGVGRVAAHDISIEDGAAASLPTINQRMEHGRRHHDHSGAGGVFAPVSLAPAPEGMDVGARHT